MPQPVDGPWHYQQIELGWNYRMTDLHAALGCSQLDRLDHYVAKRHQLAAAYDVMLEGLPLTPLSQREECYSSFHLYVVRIDFNTVSLSKPELFQVLRERGLGVNIHYIPVNTQPYYAQGGRVSETK